MEIDTSEVDGRIAVVRLDGRLNMVAAPRLKAAIEGVVEAGGTHVVVDLTAVSFMDSSGLGALIAAIKSSGMPVSGSPVTSGPECASTPTSRSSATRSVNE